VEREQASAGREAHHRGARRSRHFWPGNRRPL